MTMVLPGMIADISNELARLPVMIATLVGTRLLAPLFAWTHFDADLVRLDEF